MRAFSIFDDSLFEKVILCEVKHLLTWCAEVLTADFWGFFFPESITRDEIIIFFIQQYNLGLTY